MDILWKPGPEDRILGFEVGDLADDGKEDGSFNG